MISDNDLSTESSSSDESSDDSSNHTPSSSSPDDSRSESEGESELTAQLTDEPVMTAAGSRVKGQGQMNSSHRQCTHSETSWQPWSYILYSNVSRLINYIWQPHCGTAHTCIAVCISMHNCDGYFHLLVTMKIIFRIIIIGSFARS